MNLSPLNLGFTKEQLNTSSGIKVENGKLSVVGNDGTVRGVGSSSVTGRPSLLLFGNSIAGQSSRSMAVSTTTLTAEVKAGQTVIPVASVAGLAANDKIIVGLYYGGVHMTTIASVGASDITIASKLPRLARSGSLILKYTTDRYTSVRNYVGPIGAVLSKLGCPVDIIPGYGYGGSLALQIVADLPLFLKFYRPNFVLLSLFENDIASAIAGDDVKLEKLMYTAAKLCLNSGATPIFASCVPSNSINTALKSACFDYLLAKTLAINTVISGAYGFDMSKPWLDTSITTSRAPLAGWTDGVHPNANKFHTIAGFIQTAMQSIIGTGAGYANLALYYSDMAGTTGTLSGAGITGQAATGFTITADTGVTATASKTAADKQRISMSVAGASNVSTTTVTVTRSTITVPTSFSGQWIKGAVKGRINSSSNLVSMYQTALAFNDGTIFSQGQVTDFGTDPGILGEFCFETPSVCIPDGATTIALTFQIRPQTLGSPSGVAADFEIDEMAIIPGECEISECSQLL